MSISAAGLAFRIRTASWISPTAVARYARAVSTPLRGLNLHLLMEPGRSIIGSAGVLLTSVSYRKQNDGKRFLIVDAAMNDLIRPALYGAHHEIVPVVAVCETSVRMHRKL